MNGSQGIQPVVELATNNGNGYAYPIYPMMYGNGFGNSGFGGDWAWIIILLALLWGGNNGNGNGFFGNNSFDNGYAWLSNGQKEIMQNTNQGFDTLHLSNQLEGNRDAADTAYVRNSKCKCAHTTQHAYEQHCQYQQYTNSSFFHAPHLLFSFTFKTLKHSIVINLYLKMHYSLLIQMIIMYSLLIVI